MSLTLFNFAKSFINDRVDVNVFVEAYMELWRIERDAGIIVKDDAALSLCLSSMFCLTDLYNPDYDRDEHELDAQQLHTEISKLVNHSG